MFVFLFSLSTLNHSKLVVADFSISSLFLVMLFSNTNTHVSIVANGSVIYFFLHLKSVNDPKREFYNSRNLKYLEKVLKMLYNTNKTSRIYTKYTLRLLRRGTKKVVKALPPLSAGTFCSPIMSQSSANIILKWTGTFEPKSLTWSSPAHVASTVISH